MEDAPIPVETCDVRDLDEVQLGAALEVRFDEGRLRALAAALRARSANTTDHLPAFELYRSGPDDRVLHLRDVSSAGAWFVGDLHGDLLALEASLQHIERADTGTAAPIVFLGDLFDDGGYGLEVMARVLELLLSERPVTVLAGNHDEALQFDGCRFHSSVDPGDFAEHLNGGLPAAGAEVARAAIEYFARAPRALFFEDGLLAAHGGVPHSDLHDELANTACWNAPGCLQDFVWTRPHERARRKLPNRANRGCHFGREDFEAFCGVAAQLGRPVHRMIRGHDHFEARYLIHERYTRNPVLTINTLSRRLPRELYGPHVRVPCIARGVSGALPTVYRLHIGEALVYRAFPPETRIDV